MNIRTNISTFFIVNLILTFLSCSKSDISNNSSNKIDSVFGSSFNYTVTDTVGVKRTFSDTTMLLINSAKGDTSYLINGVGQIGTAAAYIIRWSTTDGNSIKFDFNDIRSSSLSEANQLILYLPYYQNNITINNGIGHSEFILLLNNSADFVNAYLLNETYYSDFNIIIIDKAIVSTSITDSAGGYISGAFNISAVTHSAKPILVTGSFSHVSSNIHN